MSRPLFVGKLVAGLSANEKTYRMITTVIYFFFVLSTVKSETEEFRLLRNLFKHYDKEVRPVYNTSDVVNVNFSLSLIQIISVVSWSDIEKEEEVKPWSQGWLIAAGACPGFCSMKRLEVFLLPLDGMLVPIAGHSTAILLGFPKLRRYPFIHLGAQEHNTMSPARTRTRAARSGVEHTNHEATAPPTCWSDIRFDNDIRISGLAELHKI